MMATPARLFGMSSPGVRPPGRIPRRQKERKVRARDVKSVINGSEATARHTDRATDVDLLLEQGSAPAGEQVAIDSFDSALEDLER